MTSLTMKLLTNSQFSGRYYLSACFVCASLILSFVVIAAQQSMQPKADSAAQSVDKESDEEERRRMFRTFGQRRRSTTPNQTTAAAKNRPRDKSTNPSRNSYSSEAVDTQRKKAVRETIPITS